MHLALAKELDIARRTRTAILAGDIVIAGGLTPPIDLREDMTESRSIESANVRLLRGDESMPLVYVNMMKGRDPEQIEKMIVAVSEAIAASLDAPIGTVRVMVNEMEEHQYGVGGKPMRVVRAERLGEES